MKVKLLASILSFVFLAGCDQVKEFTSSSVNCDNETAKQVVSESFSKVLGDVSAERVKDLIATENITIDMGKLRSALGQVTFNITDIRTNNSDPNSKKEY